jgi:hypothetical protein
VPSRVRRPLHWHARGGALVMRPFLTAVCSCAGVLRPCGKTPHPCKRRDRLRITFPCKGKTVESQRTAQTNSGFSMRWSRTSTD